ncbi:MAG: hypothetical protein QXN87_06155 [Candidatus Bathyarchaeia archaeon]
MVLRERLRKGEGKPFVLEDNSSTPTIVSVSNEVKAVRLEKRAEKLAFELLRKKQPRKKREKRKGGGMGFSWHAR